MDDALDRAVQPNGDPEDSGRSRSYIGHVAVCVGNGRRVSHGEEGDPTLYPLDGERGWS
jgi:hypothetical protein